MHCLLSLTPKHRGGGLRYARNPCSFRWSRTPWPPTSCARLPRQENRWLNLYEEQSPLPVFAFNLSVLNFAQASLFIRQRDGPEPALGENSIATSFGLHATPGY